MKITIKDKDNKDIGKQDLPVQFEEPLRIDLIRRSVLAIENNSRDRYGSDPKAGQKHSAELSRRRRKYRGSYGHGISRVPRKILSRRGTRFNWVGAQAPGTVGGRRAHPPKSEKIWSQKINKKENQKAIRSALSATLDTSTVTLRGHKAPKDYPFIIDNSFESIMTTKDLVTTLEKLGLKDELKRSSEKTIRAGKGKMRGRKYKKKKGPLLVVSDACELIKAAQNVPGIDIVTINMVNTKLLAPGAQAGRLTLYSQKAIEKIKKDNLFI